MYIHFFAASNSYLVLQNFDISQAVKNINFVLFEIYFNNM
jgi:hypothetical protein